MRPVTIPNIQTTMQIHLLTALYLSLVHENFPALSLPLATYQPAISLLCVYDVCDFAENVVLFLSIGTIIIIGTSITIIAPVISGVCVLINNFYE
jgi:hypothetical protein